MGWARQVACGGLVAWAAVASANVQNRIYLIDQSDFGHKKGFYLDIENSAPDGQVCDVGTFRVYLGVADSKYWRYLTVGPGFHVGQKLHIEATVGTAGDKLTVNDVTDTSTGPYAPADGPTLVAEIPDWASGAANYRIVEDGYSLGETAGRPPQFARSPAMLLFENPVAVLLKHFDAKTFQLSADVSIEALMDPSPYKPLLDKYAQSVQAQFPGKITSDEQLTTAWKADDAQLAGWKQRSDVDVFGGETSVPWATKGTGFYRTAKRNGYWWLISPQGHPLFYTGLCTAPALHWDSTPVTGRADLFAEIPPKTGDTANLWSQNPWGGDNADYVALHGANLVRRFGPNWEAAAKDEFRTRLRKWGFSGEGKWCEPMPNTPFISVMSVTDVPKIDRHIDVFDRAIQTKFWDSLSKSIGGLAKNPFVVGYSYGNEYDEIILPTEVDNILSKPESSPAKTAFIQYATEHIYAGSEGALRTAWHATSSADPANQKLLAPANDIEKCREFYAARYYQFLYRSFKSIDPNHLYMGFWIVPNWWVNDKDWDLIAANVDVIGFDRYSDWPGIEGLLARHDKPVLLGEFSFPSWYDGARGFGRYQIYTNSDAEAGQRYSNLLAAAARSPQCVGALWFQYRDEPILGRGPISGSGVIQGEHFAFGMIDACDLPKMDLVRQVRAANRGANATRLKLTH